MTLHASKGLEFDYVFLPFWVEDQLPTFFNMAEDESQEQRAEEERRLAFVGVTRGRKQVYVSHFRIKELARTFSGFFFSFFEESKPSRFINELSLGEG